MTTSSSHANPGTRWDTQSIDVLHEYDFHHNKRLRYRTYSPRKKKDVEMYRLLMEHSDVDLDYSTTSYRKIDLWWRACPDIPCMKWLRSKVISEHGKHAWQRLVDNAISGSDDFHLPDMFLAMLGYENVVEEMLTIQDSHGTTPLDLAATQIPDRIENSDPIIGASWFDFTVKLVLLGANVHKQNDSGMSPLIALLGRSPYTSADFTKVLQRWVQALEAARVDLSSYSETEKALWKECQHSHRIGRGRTVVSWTSGPQSSDWTVQVRRLHVLPIYRLDTLPGAWPSYKEDNFWTIIWTPTEDDNISTPWTWNEIDQVILRVNQPDVDQDLDRCSENTLSMRSFVTSLNFARSQDDCREVVRLVERCSRTLQRSRSSSQRAGKARKSRFCSGDMMLSQGWLPPCHFCLADGQLRFGNTGEDKFCAYPNSNEYERRCIKGVHNFAPADIWYGPSGIKAAMDRCRRQYERNARV